MESVAGVVQASPVQIASIPIGASSDATTPSGPTSTAVQAAGLAAEGIQGPRWAIQSRRMRSVRSAGLSGLVTQPRAGCDRIASSSTPESVCCAVGEVVVDEKGVIPPAPAF